MKTYKTGDRVGKFAVSQKYFDERKIEHFIKDILLDQIRLIDVLPVNPITDLVWHIGTCDHFDPIKEEEIEYETLPVYHIVFSKHGMEEVTVKVVREGDKNEL